jgi:hypothetical protein
MHAAHRFLVKRFLIAGLIPFRPHAALPARNR